MKKIMLSVLCAGIVASAANAQMIIGPELGLNMSNISMKMGGSSISTSMKAGLAVGANVNFGLSDNIYLQPGIFYLMNGCKAKDPASGGDITFNVSTIEIPVNVQYLFGEAGGNRFFVGVGPYFGYNIGGNQKMGGSSTSLKIGSTKPDASGNGGDDIKAMDVGAGINVGYLLANGVFFRVHYQIGFSNLDPMSDADNSMKSSALGVTVGYNIGGKTKKAGKK